MTDTHPLTDDFARDAAENVKPSLALVRRSPFDQLGELAKYLDVLDTIAQQLSKATILPKAMQAPANLKLVLLQGLEMGFSPIQAMRASFVIETRNEGAKVGYYVDSLVALVRSSGVCRFWRVDETTAERCRVTCARKDEDESIVHAFELTMQAARAAGLDKKNEWDPEQRKLIQKQKYPWLTAPADMLRARCQGRAVKSVFQDVVFGMATGEELDDLGAAEVLERAGGFQPIPMSAALIDRVSPPPSSAPSQTRKPATDVVDADVLPIPPEGMQYDVAGNLIPLGKPLNDPMPIPGDDDYPPAPAPDERSGDAGWDTFLETLRTAAGIDTRGWLPADLMKMWESKIDSVRTRQQLNLLGPWISEISKQAASSKACAECAAAMKASFNAANVALRKSEKPA